VGSSLPKKTTNRRNKNKKKKQHDTMKNDPIYKKDYKLLSKPARSRETSALPLHLTIFFILIERNDPIGKPARRLRNKCPSSSPNNLLFISMKK
jgi:hypothetical protein